MVPQIRCRSSLHHAPIPTRPADFSEAGDNTGFAGFSGLTWVKVGNTRAKTLPRC